jgi:MATE family, multidrug efflux pump
MPILKLARTAIPLYLTTAASSAGSIVNTVLPGHRATASLAAFALAMAVYGPVVAAVTGVMRGVMPFVAGADGGTRLALRRGGS